MIYQQKYASSNLHNIHKLLKYFYENGLYINNFIEMALNNQF